MELSGLMNRRVVVANAFERPIWARAILRKGAVLGEAGPAAAEQD
jgi:hypothetical protein